MDGQRPIGWWLKRLDSLLEAALDSAVAGEDLTRRHWQVLHSLAEGPGRESGLRATLADFRGDVGTVVTELVQRRWVERSADDVVALTAEGRVAHDRAGTAIAQVRLQLTDGLSAQEYEQTVRALGRMAENLERALAADRSRAGR